MIVTAPCPSTSLQPDLRTPTWLNLPLVGEDFLIERAQSGDLEAYNQLVLLYQDRVYRHALWMLTDEPAAEDAAQEIFLLVYRKLHTFHGGPFRPWLMRIATNYCLDQIRAARRHTCLAFSQFETDDDEVEPYWVRDSGATPEQVVERAETADRLACAIRSLAPIYRTAILLVDVQELDYSEAATIMGMPVGTLKSRVSRARKMLRDALAAR
jgi:RNA polymerase sigma-70 factor (ECF subfamily)